MTAGYRLRRPSCYFVHRIYRSRGARSLSLIMRLEGPIGQVAFG